MMASSTTTTRPATARQLPWLTGMSALSLSFSLLLSLVPAARAAEPAAPPNLVEVTERIVTSGQPSAAWLASLKTQGFEAVIYLAPPTVHDAVHDEALIVGRQGLVFVNVPVDFAAPSAASCESFARIMQALEGKKVLVHCEGNLRASSFTFLYRVLYQKALARPAFDFVSRVWAPDDAWQRLILEQLRAHRIAFEPF